ncbi:MAG: S41 family peptidase [Chitinophagaceae bacterium]
MRNIFLCLLSIIVLSNKAFTQTTNQQTVGNLIAFAKLYGYVRYFHPSDEAAALNWNAFVIYGSKTVMAAQNDDDLIKNLQNLFYPIAPAIKIYKTGTATDFINADLLPADIKNYKPVAWQHYGIGLGNSNSIYWSARTNTAGYDSIDKWRRFNETPKPEELIQKALNKNISVIVPLVLYGNKEHTYPVADGLQLSNLQKQLLAQDSLESNSRFMYLADVIIAWNIFRHFFAYWEDAAQDPETILHNALEKTLKDKSDNDVVQTLRLMTAPLNDGHIGVWNEKNPSFAYYTPIMTTWAENKLVVAHVLNKQTSANLNAGDIILSINDTAASDWQKNRDQYNSGSKQLKQSRSDWSILRGEQNSAISLTVEQKGVVNKISLQRNVPMKTVFDKYTDKTTSGFIKPSVFYIDLNKWPMDSIKSHLEDLKNSKAIICDLRGYPNANHEFIRYLITDKETDKWMFVPQIIYPDFEKVSYHEEGWSLQPLKPHLSAKVVFITDGRAISYAESYMGYIKDLKLATIVGQPTAGTNGNINTINLPGGFHVLFTGMLVKNHDGSKHHLKGIQPDVLVEPTIKGIAEGRDEMLEKALQLAEQ